ncbi:MAG: Hsp20/alpha crystallin family protein [Chitinophagaceae bacterium]|nr:Hsp20/alpha crystallin family protein [Chitinophagaceae bacterium]
MTLVKFNRKPFESTFNNLVDEIFNDMPALFKNDNNVTDHWNGFAPVNIKELEKSYILDLVAPGFDKVDFKVNLENDMLTISAEKKEEMKNVNEKEIRKEYSHRSFKRSFTLDEKIDAGAIEAKYVNGVLTLNLPKKEEVKPASKQISIQ